MSVTPIPLVIPSINEFLGWIVAGGIVTILVVVWRVGVGIERRIGDLKSDLGKEIKGLEGDKKVLVERADTVKDNIDKMDNRLKDIERVVWQLSPSRAKSIRERIDAEQEHEGEDRTP